MKKPTYRFYGGERSNPFDREQDLTPHILWLSEKLHADTASNLDMAAFYVGWKPDMPEFIEAWDAPDEDKGLLFWSILQCEKWAPYDAGEVDWELYTRSTRR